ncbi:hypothetical protein GQ53DRAFT_725964 [Thozetella sp. PMI_491]|nr:hypothetical protein GQ53DRAFT_725964 [Thozetella sp. PMI_491]
MSFFRQTWTLMSKNFRIVLVRHGFATWIRAFLLPIALMAFLAFAKNLFVPPAVYGIGTSHPVRSLQDALAVAGNTGRETVAFVHNGFQGGEIQRVIDDLTPIVTGAGKTAAVLASESELPRVCRASLRGVTPCYGAVVFRGSPSEGTGGLWNYTIRVDSSLGAGRVNVKRDDNDGEIYMLPFQHAIDAAISRTNNGTGGRVALPATLNEYPFTPQTPAERDERIRVLYQDSIMNFLGVSFIAGLVGISYHMTGFMASERETGMATLIEAMLPTKRTWHAQAARLLSYHLSFSLVYLPGWVIGSAIISRSVFATTNAGLVIIYHILTGLALASMSIFVASFFKKSQLSGVTVTIVQVLLAIAAQTVTWPRTPTVTVLSFLFPPCNYTYFISLLARWEKELTPTDLARTAPNSPWNLPGIALWVFLIIQIIAYPLIGAFIERSLHGTTSNSRNIVTGENRGDLGEDTAVQLEGFTKIYKAGIFRRLFSFISKPKEPVIAVNNLTLHAGRGQILALLGANGSGKSTTLDSVAGINKLTSGRITIDGTGGIGIAPQKNVLWDELTVEEHIAIFNKLKSPYNHASKQEIRELVAAIDLTQKIKAQSKTLSGGQKRKLQLGMMLTGGSAVCCVDEVSSGIDPLSRRKIWDILLAERGRRTMILTTHFLDEADLLADHIAILSKGTLRAEGSSVELKDKLGKGYRIHVQNAKELGGTPDVDGVAKKVAFDVVTYTARTSGLAAQVIKALESVGINDYSFSGPSIEDVFLEVAEEVRMESSQDSTTHKETQVLENHSSSDEKTGPGDESEKGGLELLSGQRITAWRQTGVLFLKRCTIFKGNWFPYAAAFFIPIIAAGLVTLFVRKQQPVGCSLGEGTSLNIAVNVFNSNFRLFLLAGPSSKVSNQTLLNLFLPLYLNSVNTSGLSGGGSNGTAFTPASLFQNVTLVDTFDDFNRLLEVDRKNVTPAAFWLGDDSSPPTVAYKATTLEIFDAWFGQWALNMLLTNTTLASTYVSFDIPWAPDTGNSLQLVVYIGLALSAYPGFFALYPNLERRRHVRGLQYSNGVQILPLWSAYVLFDFAIVVVGAGICTALLAGLSHVWYHIGYVFVVFMFYGLASTILGYVISILATNQLSAYAFTAAGQAVMVLVYLIAYLCTITYAPVNRIDNYLILVHFLVSAFAPIGSVMRALFLALNLFSATCDGEQLAANPGGILQYGGPILYLIVQSIIFFGLLLWLDSGNVGSTFQRLMQKRPHQNLDDPNGSDEEVANELARVTSTATGGSGTSTTDGLRVMHLTKTFGSNTAVDNVTFGIKRGEVFALLGPNGAGKSTTISLIRGDIKPSYRGGDVFVEDVSVTKHLAQARSHLGVCPQFDAVDQMTVSEHLRFYARVRGIPDVEHNVRAVIQAVGLQAFHDRQAHALSGGNKRKLSLGIALMGNPTVVLLDEPSSGLDAAAKRIMWRTLAATVHGRSILLTTHSMEEADALAGRAGILAKRMLAMGTTEQLRAKFGDSLYVHIVCRGAPRTPDEDVAKVAEWVVDTFPGATIEGQTYHGQMRFSVPASKVGAPRQNGEKMDEFKEEITEVGEGRLRSATSAIGRLVVALEESKHELGIDHYSVSPTTLDQVFLTVVGRHNVQEEGYEQREKKPWWRFGR